MQVILYNQGITITESKGTSVLPRKRPVVQKVGEVPTEAPAAKNALTIMVVISVLFLLLSASYNYLTPASTITQQDQHPRDGGAANPDEPAHVLYVASAASGRLPVFSKTSANYEAHQPPLYYILAATFYQASPTSAQHSVEFEGRVHVVRWAATLLGLALIWVTFFIAADLLPDRRDIAALAAAIVALIPMNISLSSSVSNDTATNLVFALFLLILGRLIRNPAKKKYTFLLGVIVGIGIWTKSSTLILAPVLLIALGFAAWRNLLSYKEAWISAAASLGLGAIIGLPWLLRNRHLYGDLFAQGVVFRDLAARNVSPSSLIQALGPNWYLQHFFGWTFASYWGVFDSMLLFLPQGVYVFLALAALATIVAGLIVLKKKPQSGANGVVLFMWAALVALTLIAYVQYNVHFFQVQGRYLYPALIPLSALSAIGISALTPPSLKRWLPLILISGLLVLNLLCLSIISGRYSA